jgi:hypothetical protein
MLTAIFVFLSIVFLGLAQPAAAVEGQRSIQIVTAFYGEPDAARPVNFAARLQQTCGDQAADCQVFCDNSLVGHADNGLRLPFGQRPICRVTYRCGAEATLATDSQKNDYILLSCRSKP